MQNEAKKSKRRRCAQNDSLSTQSEYIGLFITPAYTLTCKRWASCVNRSLLGCMLTLRYWEHACVVNWVMSLVWFLFGSGMYQDVQGQLGDEKAPAHPRAPCARLCRVWQSICGEFETEEAPTGTHGRETFPGESFSSDEETVIVCKYASRKDFWISAALWKSNYKVLVKFPVSKRFTGTVYKNGCCHDTFHLWRVAALTWALSSPVHIWGLRQAVLSGL